MTVVCVIGGHTPSLTNFRGPLLRAMRARGHEVIAVGGGHDPDVAAVLARDGIGFVPLPIARAALNPLHDLRCLHALGRLLREVRPDVVLAYTHKPIVYASIARALVQPSAQVFGLVTGLGFAFGPGENYRRRLARAALLSLYKAASRCWHGVIFQNPDDQRFFVANRLIDGATPRTVVRGSGVDLRHFQASDVPDGPPRFVLIARLLVDKGIREYVAAARRVKRAYPNAEFHLAGPLDTNPTSVGAEELRGWIAEGIIVYHGSVKDVRPLLRSCAVFVLPSAYGEGTPRTILEAMATGRAVITTDAPGCRETVFDTAQHAGRPLARDDQADSDRGLFVEGANGILVPPRSPSALTAAMMRLASSPERYREMGGRGRWFAEQYYDVDLVNDQMLGFMRL